MRDLQMEGRSVQGTDLGVRVRGPSAYSLPAPPDLTLSVAIVPIPVADASGLRYQSRPRAAPGPFEKETSGAAVVQSGRRGCPAAKPHPFIGAPMPQYQSRSEQATIH